VVIAAEKRRAVALGLVAEFKERLAAVEEEMIPYYKDKAQAKQDLAAATTAAATYRKKIEELGYRQIDLKDSEQDSEHQIRSAEYDYEISQELHAKASAATDLFEEYQQDNPAKYQTEIEKVLLAREQFEEIRFRSEREHGIRQKDNEQRG